MAVGWWVVEWLARWLTTSKRIGFQLLPLTPLPVIRAGNWRLQVGKVMAERLSQERLSQAYRSRFCTSGIDRFCGPHGWMLAIFWLYVNSASLRGRLHAASFQQCPLYKPVETVIYYSLTTNGPTVTTATVTVAIVTATEALDSTQQASQLLPTCLSVFHQSHACQFSSNAEDKVIHLLSLT